MLELKNRRECFFDNFLIDENLSNAEKRLHKPVRKRELLVLDKPWEGKENLFFCPIYADGKWKLYYASIHEDELATICYAESDNGIDWVRPELGIVEYEGSKKNNILMDSTMMEEFDFAGLSCCFSVFYDENPKCPKDEKYKMTIWWSGHASLISFMSADGIHFGNPKFITDDGAFDSQNRSFWSKEHNKYFCYYRGEHDATEDVSIIDKSYTDKTANALFDPKKFLLREPGAGTYTFMRDIRVIESDDHINWTEQKLINTTGKDCQLYNNVIFPYPRAPHIFIGFALRYAERKRWTKAYDELCGKEERIERMNNMARLGLAMTDCLFMSTRDGYNFEKYDEAFITPPVENPNSFLYGDGMVAPAVIEVPSEIPGADNEYMIINRENYRIKRDFNKLVSYNIRLDGFVSLHAGGEVKKVLTKEFTYTGEDLFVNMATSARGFAYFTLKCGDEEYTSCEMFGNSVNKRIRFEDDGIVKNLAGKPVTLRIEMSDCDIYSIKFE